MKIGTITAAKEGGAGRFSSRVGQEQSVEQLAGSATGESKSNGPIAPRGSDGERRPGREGIVLYLLFIAPGADFDEAKAPIGPDAAEFWCAVRIRGGDPCWQGLRQVRVVAAPLVRITFACFFASKSAEGLGVPWTRVPWTNGVIILLAWGPVQGRSGL